MSDQEQKTYRVLARKYRPSTFGDLVGQEAMVQTLTNAFQMNRIAQAYMLTGVRGIGKTTTARILARALNYEKNADGNGEAVTTPQIDMPNEGIHCSAIIESRHVDVIEMDAASNTSINDIREIIEASRYKPASARYKVYIIDEVHMLSTAAFNGLLKTLEEPPAHVKFIFATTEIRKVPITILSRCQRFDLRRFDAETMISYLKSIAEKENVSLSDEAFQILARASEGSARDGLSLLDQAIAHSFASESSEIDAKSLQEMLGLADRTRIIGLLENLLSGKISAGIEEFKDLYDAGADPQTILSDLSELAHLITRLKVAPQIADQGVLSPREKEQGQKLATKLSLRTLSTCWQILQKGILETAQSSRPHMAAEMVLLRIAYAADSPSPQDALAILKNKTATLEAGGVPTDTATNQLKPASLVQSYSTAKPTLDSVQLKAVIQTNLEPEPIENIPELILNNLQDVANLAGEKKDIQLKIALERFIRPVKFDQGRVDISLENGAPPNIAGELGSKLSEWTGKRWFVSIVKEAGEPTLVEKTELLKTAQMNDVMQSPLVKAALECFPGAKITNVVDYSKKN